MFELKEVSGGERKCKKTEQEEGKGTWTTDEGSKEGQGWEQRKR